jgi:hypothetical protein
MIAFGSTATRITANDPTRLGPAGMKAVIGILFALLAATSCASTPTAQDLRGKWASNATVTQRGTTSETFCFAGDDSLEWTAQTPAGTSTHRGTYKLVGNVLTIQTPDLDTAPTLTASLRLGKLELTSPSGSTQKYARVLGTCDDKRK